MPISTRFGGSFAPPLSDAILASYASLIEATDPNTELGEALRRCFACVDVWWGIPESCGPLVHHAGSPFIIDGQVRHVSAVELDTVTQTSLWDTIPWEYEIVHYGRVFDGILDRTLRNCAFHLLWHVKELDNDREPITQDKI